LIKHFYIHKKTLQFFEVFFLLLFVLLLLFLAMFFVILFLLFDVCLVQSL